MTAPASGSEAAMVAAQHAPIGAKICTTRAIRTIGRKFFSRLRIANPSVSELITLRVRSRDQVPVLSSMRRGINPADPGYPNAAESHPLLYYLHTGPVP